MMRMRRASFGVAILGALALGGVAFAVDAKDSPAHPLRNVVIFIADGLRYGSVNREDAPTLLYVRERGVNFVNSHAVFPTFTMTNAAVIATGHYVGDTGNYGNTMYLNFPVFNGGRFGNAPGSFTPFIEHDQVLGDIDAHFEGGNYLNEASLLSLARVHGYSTAAIGKLGPVAIQDVTQINAAQGRFPTPQTIVLDDATGLPSGVPLSAELQDALLRAGLQTAPPPRRQPGGNLETPGALQANLAQQQFFVDATTKAVLPLFKQRGKPFLLVYWSRDPDGTQHNHGDSHQSLVPGINGPTSRAAVRNADDNLKQILDYLQSDPSLAANTNVFVTSDHGFATVSRGVIDAEGHLTKSYAAQFQYRDRSGKPEVAPGRLPLGFLAIDVAHALDLPLFDPDVQIEIDGEKRYATIDPRVSQSTATQRQRPVIGNGFIGGSGKRLAKPDNPVVVTAGGGSDLIYVLNRDVALVRRIVEFLGKQDYVGGVFVDSRYGKLPGALPLSAIALEGAGRLPRPAIVVNFKSFSTDPSNPLMTAVQIADTSAQEGQGMHGSLGRDNTYNNMAAIGPDFKSGYVDEAPVGNADITPTLARILGWKLPNRGALTGRVLLEALTDGPPHVSFRARTAVAKPRGSNKVTVLKYQTVGRRRYFDVACFIDERAAKQNPIDPCGS